jgi:DNA-binding response OmpR family regulator
MPDQPVRVLLVEDDPTDALLVREASELMPALSLAFSPVERLGDALCWPGACCDTVPLDLGLPDSGGIETFAAVPERASGVPIAC